MIVRRQTRKIQIGMVPVGGGSPIAVQSMTNTDTADAESTVKQILDEAKTTVSKFHRFRVGQ